MSPKLNRRGFVTALLAAPVASAFTWPAPTSAMVTTDNPTLKDAARWWKEYDPAASDPIKAMAEIACTFTDARSEYPLRTFHLDQMVDTLDPDDVRVVFQWLRELEAEYEERVAIGAN